MIFTLHCARCPAPTPRGRRGAILLLVLSMLTLFMMIGTLMMVLATRARTTARAFADAVTGSGLEAAEARRLLDEALMVLVRGRPAEQDEAEAPPARESLLADRYGPDFIKGRLRAVTANGAVLEAKVDGISAPDLPGRILTIRPNPDDPTPVSSFRILSAQGGDLVLANLRTTAVRSLPDSGKLPCDAYVNGREFTGTSGSEAWDAFDEANEFLAKVVSGQEIKVERPSYGGGDPTVDNDGDGVPDGTWFDDVVPNRPGGGTARVSYLVLDLGGRLNVNAHGSLDPANAGSGPAAVDGSAAIPKWQELLRGGSSSEQPNAPGPERRRGSPGLGGPLDGRFGRAAAETYSQRLDFDGPRFASRQENSGNLFTCGELEWILRPFDRDTTTLPARLAALLGDDAEDVRLLVTTDSWDTCGLTGDVAREIAGKAGGGQLPAEVAEGVRLNLDQPMDTDEERQQFFQDLYDVVVAAGVPRSERTAQWVANVCAFLDADQEETQYTVAGGGSSVKGVEPSTLDEALRGKLGDWDLGSVESAALLLGVPSDDKRDMERNLREEIPMKSLAAEHPEILDAVTVASPFRETVFVRSGDRTLCRWREPGRINANTCSDEAWRAMVGDDTPNPFKNQPARRPSDLLLKVPQVFSGQGFDVTTLNRELANRLANVGTTRSDVFAVWVTLELKAGENAEPSFHRLFAIVDRSIPVGHAPGLNLNARDTLRVIRHLE